MARVLLIILCALSGSATGADNHNTTYTLVLAANRPPCEAPPSSDRDSDREKATRCRGKRESFSLRANSILWFPQNEAAPAAFVFLGPLAVEPFTYPAAALGISIQQSVEGVIVEAVFGVQKTSRSVAFDRWQQIHLPPHTSFWVQVKRGN
jgi:hypothetical protein